jgi:precorrin-3B methylase
MVVNDNADNPNERAALESIASKPAPTGVALSVIPGIDAVFCRSWLVGSPHRSDGRQR